MTGPMPASTMPLPTSKMFPWPLPGHFLLVGLNALQPTSSRISHAVPSQVQIPHLVVVVLIIPFLTTFCAISLICPPKALSQPLTVSKDMLSSCISVPHNVWPFFMRLSIFLLIRMSPLSSGGGGRCAAAHSARGMDACKHSVVSTETLGKLLGPALPKLNGKKNICLGKSLTIIVKNLLCYVVDTAFDLYLLHLHSPSRVRRRWS